MPTKFVSVASTSTGQARVGEALRRAASRARGPRRGARRCGRARRASPPRRRRPGGARRRTGTSAARPPRSAPRSRRGSRPSRSRAPSRSRSARCRRAARTRRPGCPDGDGGVQQPRAVEMDGEPELAGGVDRRRQLVERPDAPAGAAVRLLEDDDPRRLEPVRGRDRLADLVGRDPAGVARRAAGRSARSGPPARPPRRSGCASAPRRSAGRRAASGRAARSGSPSSPSAGRARARARAARPRAAGAR